jgi:hypothetical protein
MKIHKDYITLFESYSENSMIDTDKVSFEARLAYDEEFKKQFLTFNQLQVDIKKHFSSEIKQKLSALDDELDTSASAEVYQAPPSKWRLWIPITAVAASLLLVLVMNIAGGSQGLLAEKHWIKDPGLPVKMSTKGSYDDAMNHYKLKEWEACLDELTVIDSDTSYYYQGQVHYYLEDFQQGIGVLSKITSSSSYYSKACFSQAILYLKLEKTAEAKKLLVALSEGNSAYSEKAALLLSEI